MFYLPQNIVDKSDSYCAFTSNESHAWIHVNGPRKEQNISEKYKYSCSGIRTNNSYYKTFQQFECLHTAIDLHRVMSSLFPWIFYNGRGMPAGNAYPSGHLVPILWLACAPIVETRFLELSMSLLDFSPWIPLGTFSILLGT